MSKINRYVYVIICLNTSRYQYYQKYLASVIEKTEYLNHFDRFSNRSDVVLRI